RRADRSRRADVVRAVRRRAALEVVALDRALEALALGSAGDLDLVADRERVGLHGLAHQQFAGLATELADDAVGGGVRLLQMPELGLRQRLLAAGVERELDGLVAVPLDGPDRRDRARPGLEHRHALNAAVLEEPLRHTELSCEDRRHLRYLGREAD